MTSILRYLGPLAGCFTGGFASPLRAGAACLITVGRSLRPKHLQAVAGCYQADP
jgi:hypothetical protein